MMFLILLFLPYLSFASTDSPVISYMHEELDSFSATGFIQLDDCKSDGTLRINGNLVANHTLIEDLEVNGQLFLSQCVVKGFTTVLGTFQSTKTVFESEVTATAQDIQLFNSVTENIHLKKAGNYDGTQVVKLKSCCLVRGNIAFDSKKGEVWLYRGSKMQGAVIGGKIVAMAETE